MRRYSLIAPFILLILFAFGCAPVINKDIMSAAIRDVPLSDIKQNPEIYKGNLFVIGGIIINTKAAAEGSLIEALYVPVDSRGYLKGIGTSHGRFLALFPKESGFLDPLIFKREREVTIAGEYLGTREGKIDEMQYEYPFFKIKELYLWAERKEYYVVPPYYYEPYPYWWDYPYYRWGYPYYRWGYPYWW
jgi:outer membrane lipoprotein